MAAQSARGISEKMTIDAYFNPDFTWDKKFIYFLMAFAGMMICVFLIIGITVIGAKLGKKKDPDETYEEDGTKAGGISAELVLSRVQMFYEMVISGTTAIFFACSYIIMNHLYVILSDMQAGSYGEPYLSFMYIWDNYKDFVLLLFICLSCILGRILDSLLIPLKLIQREEKASIRLLAMFYAIAVLIFLNHIGDESEYSPVMMYYLGLMVGRFIYFDASFKDFLETMGRALSNVFMLILGLCLMGGLCYFGFGYGFLLERNYYIVGVFYTHLFLLAVIFILHHSRIFKLLLSRKH